MFILSKTEQLFLPLAIYMYVVYCKGTFIKGGMVFENLPKSSLQLFVFGPHVSLLVRKHTQLIFSHVAKQV